MLGRCACLLISSTLSSCWNCGPVAQSLARPSSIKHSERTFQPAMAALHDVEKSPPEYSGSYEVDPTKSNEDGAHLRKSSVVNRDVLTGEVFDDRYESTQRGLKSRHAQMIALGGTIGTGLFVCIKEQKKCLRDLLTLLSIGRFWPNTCTWWSSFHPRSLHLHVLFNLVHRYWYH